jgi:hypothetical protein
MLCWGFEKEFFLLNAQNEPQVIDANLRYLGYDDCGWLVEARSKPFSSIVEAVFSLKADIHRIEKKLAQKDGLVLSDQPLCKIDKKTRIKAHRQYSKPPIKYQNFYGYQFHRNAALEATAGLHVSVTQKSSVYNKDGTSTEYYKNFDWPFIFLAIDKEFKEEIKAAKRNPGFYEMKSDGRVEYRSLPANVDLDKLISVLSDIQSKID